MDAAALRQDDPARPGPGGPGSSGPGSSGAGDSNSGSSKGAGATTPALRDHGGDHVAEALQIEGVTTVFTLCGGHISPILAAAKARGIRIVDTRDEVTAVFAADAHARLTGKPGVAAVTAGPGLTNTLTALKNAQQAQSPLLLLAGAAPTALQGRGALQDIAQRPLVQPHVKFFKAVRKVRDLGPAVHEAFATAMADVPGPTCVECPVDLLYDEALIRDWYEAAGGRGQSLAERALRFYLDWHVERMFHGADDRSGISSMGGHIPTASEPSQQAALARLATAQRPLMVIGSQALVEAPQAQAVAEAVGRLGIPVYLSGMARGLLGRDHPLQLRHHRREALREADWVLLAGVPCDFRLDYGRHVRRSATLVAANRSRRDARLNRRPTVTAIGDAGLFIQQLAELRGQGGVAPGIPPGWQGWVEQLRTRDAERELNIDSQGQAPGEHVNPIGLLRAVDAVAGDNAIFVADGGDFVSTAAYVLRPRSPLSWLDPGVFGTLGVGAGFVMGAAAARPGAELWLIWGDGACGWGLAEIDSFVRHGIAVIMVVGNDAAWTQIAREQVKMLGDDVGTVLARTDYHRVAEGFGAAGIVLKQQADVLPGLQRAREIAHGGQPVLVNAWLDGTRFREGSLSM